VHEQLAAIGKKNNNAELVNVALNSLPSSWELFVKGFYAWEHLLDW
jgi:hypothetical protein